MPLNIISYKKAIWKGIEGHLKGIVQKLEDSQKQNHQNQISEHMGHASDVWIRLEI